MLVRLFGVWLVDLLLVFLKTLLVSEGVFRLGIDEDNVNSCDLFSATITLS